MLCLVAALHPVESVAGAAGHARGGDRDDRDGRRQRLHQLHGRGDRRRSFRTQADAIAEARRAGAEIVAGGGTDDCEGWFVEPTLIKTDDPGFRLLRDELFGPVVTAYVYDETKWDDTLDLVDETAPYALTGAVFSNDRYAIDQAHDALRYAAGNFYVNDKPTGAVVGQQPFGGARASGTNDKAGSMWNLIRWVSPRHGEGDARAAARLPLPVPRSPTNDAAPPGLALAGVGRARPRSRCAARRRALPPLPLCVALGVAGRQRRTAFPVCAVRGPRLRPGSCFARASCCSASISSSRTCSRSARRRSRSSSPSLR